MSNSHYYGEIAAKISAHLFQNPDLIMELDLVMNRDQESEGTTLWTISADAARVFDTIEDLSGEHFIDWHRALEFYAEKLLDHLLTGETPHTVDMISMASLSLQDAR